MPSAACTAWTSASPWNPSPSACASCTTSSGSCSEYIVFMPATTAPALSVHALRKSYGDVVAVDGLDLEVRRGECFGLLGPNGAGKTTTIEICEGLTPHDAGEVEVLGLRWSHDARALRERLGIQLQETQLADKLTVLETVTLFRSFYRHGPEPEAVLATVQL